MISIPYRRDETGRERAIRAPEQIYLNINEACNLRCIQCDIYKLKNPTDELTLDERRDVIRQVSSWNPQIRIAFSGGEPFMRPHMLYALAETCRDLNVTTRMVTNGTLIRDSDFARIPDSGLRHIGVSLDSDEPEVHDRIRGSGGTFERAVATIKRLVEIQRSTGGLSVHMVTILGQHNMQRVPQLVSFGESLGVNFMMFQPLQPVLARPAGARWWQDDPLFPRDMETADWAVDQLIELREKGRRLYQTSAQFEDIRAYFRSPAQTVPGLCASMERYMMIDIRGDTRLCFNMEKIGLAPIGSVRRSRLRDLWEAHETATTRQEMQSCRESCGVMLCHSR